MTEQTETRPEREGWAFPGNARKAHYFVGLWSLCDRWMFRGEFQGAADAPPSKDDCKECTRLLSARIVAGNS